MTSSQFRVAFQYRPANRQLLYLVDQRSTLQAKFGRCAVRASDYPTGGLKRVQNQSAFAFFKIGRRPRNGYSLSSSDRQGIGKHAVIGKDHGALDQVLQLADVT